MANWKKDYSPNVLIQQIEKSRIATDTESVTFDAWRNVEHRALLYSMVQMSDEILEIEGRNITQKAIFIAGRKGVITAKNLLSEINILEREHIALPIHRYVLVTSLSLQQYVKLPRIRINGATIIFEPQLPERFQIDADEKDQFIRQSLFVDPPDNYLNVRVHVSARSIHEAADSAFNAIDLVRGIWNWHYNRGQFIRISGGRPMPVNKVVTGPLHTLHKPNGKLATETHWYESRYLGPVTILNPQDLDKLNKSFKTFRRKLAQNNYRKYIEDAIIRYTRALDERDWSTSFLKLWIVLEILTNSGHESYKVTIRRASFLYEERDYSQQVLRHLRDFRNQFVHADADNYEIETYMYQLKNIVEVLLEFHLGSKFGFKTMVEASTFLDMPPDKNILDSKSRMLNYAQKFRKHI